MNNLDLSSEREITARAINSFAHTPDARLRFLLEKLVSHLHQFASEVELNEAEWLQAIRFLTATGQKCDDVVRQEFILLSDVLGLSMLVDAIEHRSAVEATQSTVFGPFYMAGMPEREYGENMALIPGSASLITGYVRDASGNPCQGPPWMCGRPRKTVSTRVRMWRSRTATCAVVTTPMNRGAMRFAAWCR